MRKLLISLGVLIVLIVAAGLAAPFLIPAERYRGLIEAQVEKATGRDFQIRGPMKLSLLPNPHLELNDVHLANRPGGRATEMASFKRLDLGVALRPLLDRRIEVEKVVLIEPRIALEVGKDGVPNWDFEKDKEANKPKEDSAGQSLTFRFAGLELKDGRFSHADLRKKDRGVVVEDVSLSVDLSDLDSPVRATGDLVYRGERVDLSLEAAKPRALTQGIASPVRARIQADSVKLSFIGVARSGKALEAAGDLAVQVASVEELAQWLAAEKPARPLPVRTASLTTRVAAGADRAKLTNLHVKADDLEARGNLDLGFGGPRPKAAGMLRLGMLDLDAYLPSTPAVEKGAPTGPAGWSEKPIDLSGLRRADLDLHLEAGGIKRNQLTVGATTLMVKLQGGRLEASVPQTSIFGGTARGRLRVDAVGAAPSVGLDMTVTGVQAEPLLAVLANSRRLEGTTNASVSVQARGASQRALVSSLNGTADLTFLDGAIKGINIASALRQVKTVYLDPAAGSAQKTDFAELSGTFAIRNGVAHTEDLKMLAPLLRLRGKGDIALPERRIAMRLEPELVGTLKGQGGDSDRRGLKVPILVTGPLERPSFTPDLQGIAEKAIRKRLEGLAGGDQGGTGVKGVLRGLVGREPSDGTEGAGQPAANPVEGLRQLLGR